MFLRVNVELFFFGAFILVVGGKFGCLRVVGIIFRKYMECKRFWWIRYVNLYFYVDWVLLCVGTFRSFVGDKIIGDFLFKF